VIDRASLIHDLEKRIAYQREHGGDIMDYGIPDPLDVRLLDFLKGAKS